MANREYTFKALDDAITSLSNPSSWLPTDSGLLAWNFDPVAAPSSTVVTLGTLYMCKVRVTPGVAINNVLLQVGTAAANLTHAYVSLYNTSRVLLGSSANANTAWSTGTGLKTTALTAPVTPTEQYVYAGFHFYGDSSPTAPALVRGSNISVINAGGQNRFATSSTGLTGASPDPAASLAASALAFWVGLS